MKPISQITHFTVLSISFVFLATSFGCDRKPEDLDKWRNAKGGVEKIQGWATSDEEPDEVRLRAIEILVEDGHVTELHPTLEEVEGDDLKPQMIERAMAVIEEKWEKQDMPVLDEETKKKGGEVTAKPSQAEEAKDAAYYIHPHTEGENREKTESILAEWLSKDWQLRNQLGNTTLGQIAPRAGEEGQESLLAWLEEAVEPHRVTDMIKKHGKDETKEETAQILVERANEEYPDLSESLQAALFSFDHQGLVDYLKEIAEDEEAPDQLVDRSMNALVRIQGERAAPFFSDLVKNRAGTIRWVAATRLVEVLGKDAFTSVASNLPVDMDTYPETDETDFHDDTKYFCNLYKGELEDQGIESASDQLERGLKSNRWPARALALHCARVFEDDQLEEEISELTSDNQQVPGWGKRQTVGGLAKEVQEYLNEY